MDYKQFQRILKKYRMGKATPAEEAFVNAWYDSLEEGVSEEQISEVEWEKKGNRIYKTIYAKIGQPKVWYYQSIYRKMAWCAAAIIFLLGLSFWWFNNENSQPNAVAVIESKGEGIEIVEAENNTKDTMQIVLSEGTLVSLYPGASLKYPAAFSDFKREVILSGTAFFDVTRIEDAPFLVYSNAVVTKVLGTSFTIVASTTNEVEVKVHTGKVTVYENLAMIKNNSTQHDSMIISPNQMAIYKPVERRFNATLIDKPMPLLSDASTDKNTVSFLFDEAPLSKVLNDLSVVYGIEIEVENASILQCPFTGDLFGDDLFKQLHIICNVLNLTYEIRDLKVVLNGNGCNF